MFVRLFSCLVGCLVGLLVFRRRLCRVLAFVHVCLSVPMCLFAFVFVCLLVGWLVLSLAVHLLVGCAVGLLFVCYFWLVGSLVGLVLRCCVLLVSLLVGILSADASFSSITI